MVADAILYNRRLVAYARYMAVDDIGAAVLHHHVGDRPVVGDRVAEIPSGHVPEVVDVLDEERLVVPGGVAPLLELLRREPAAQGRAHGVARRDPHEEEDQRQQDQDHGDDQHQPGERVRAK